MRFVECTEIDHSEAIRSIFNHVIDTSTSMYDYKPRSKERMVTWFETKRRYNSPVIGVEGDDGDLLGFATYGPFRPFDGYKYTVEHSVYVRNEHCGKGLGSKLLTELIKKAEQQDYHIMIGCIDAENRGSIAFHERLGFVHCGTMKEVGYKFGAWRDVVFCQLTLKTPANPVEA